jgi:hypothetical protein
MMTWATPSLVDTKDGTNIDRAAPSERNRLIAKAIFRSVM